MMKLYIYNHLKYMQEIVFQKFKNKDFPAVHSSLKSIEQLLLNFRLHHHCVNCTEYTCYMCFLVYGVYYIVLLYNVIFFTVLYH